MQSLKIFNLLTFVGLLFLFAPEVGAQSTIFNMPSTDVTAPKSFYYEADFVSRLAKVENGGFQTFGSRLVYGPSKKMEIGVNAFYTKAGDAEIPVELQPNVKYQFFTDERRGLAATVGGLAYLPINHRQGTDTFGLVYANFSK